MFREVQYEDIVKNEIGKNFLLVDVRSPGEFKSETIPGAINIPIFTDEERAIIGTTYVQDSIDKAKQLGVEAAANKLPEIYEKVVKLDKEYDNIVFFCARGGFRSLTLSTLFRAIGINAIRLEGGYKGYRKYINDSLPRLVEQVKFIVLYGNTGSGKTDILKYLKEMDKDILDLEACANHRGSLFGGVGLGHPNSQKMFESLVFESLNNRKSNIVFTEGESKRIGRIVMPEYLFNAIKAGDNILIDTDLDLRVNNILKDYVNDIDDELLESLGHLKEHIGNSNVDRLIDFVRSHDYKSAIEDLMIKYYDPMYEYKNRDYIGRFNNSNSQDTAKEIITKF